MTTETRICEQRATETISEKIAPVMRSGEPIDPPQSIFKGLVRPDSASYVGNVLNEWRFNCETQNYDYVGSEPDVLEVIRQETEKEARQQ